VPDTPEVAVVVETVMPVVALSVETVAVAISVTEFVNRWRNTGRKKPLKVRSVCLIIPENIISYWLKIGEIENTIERVSDNPSMHHIIGRIQARVAPLREFDRIPDNVEVIVCGNRHIACVQYLISYNAPCVVSALEEEEISRDSHVVDNVREKRIKSVRTLIERVINITRDISGSWKLTRAC
jgi:hypothetical protein